VGNLLQRCWIPRMRLRATTAALVSAVVFLIAALTTPSAVSQTFSVLYSFNGGQDGGNPEAGVIQDAKGNLYGTTYRDGKSCGVVFKLTTGGVETPLHTFGQGGCYPWGWLVRDTAGNLYGTTRQGGRYLKGIVFKLAPNGKFTVLHKFGATPTDGAYPITGLTLDAAGNLYGTTLYGGNVKCQSGGLSGCGTVFKVSPSGKETILHRFSGANHDGANPGTGVIQDSAGNLYGATDCNTTTRGVCQPGVFKLDLSNNKVVVLDNRTEVRGLIIDAAGNLYGTGNGGSGKCSVNGCGVVFKLDSTTGQETVLYSFLGAPDGEGPLGGVIRDSAGNLYGTTQVGGNGWGTVFKVDPSGVETQLYTFLGEKDGSPGRDGAYPASALTQDSNGNLYGTTPVGGVAGCNQNGCGVVFQIAP
jgi:uncharacterized repeat protein (TIGR03803 family)